MDVYKEVDGSSETSPGRLLKHSPPWKPRIFKTDPCSSVSNRPSQHPRDELANDEAARATGPGHWQRPESDNVFLMSLGFRTQYAYIWMSCQGLANVARHYVMCERDAKGESKLAQPNYPSERQKQWDIFGSHQFGICWTNIFHTSNRIPARKVNFCRH